MSGWVLNTHLGLENGYYQKEWFSWKLEILCEVILIWQKKESAMLIYHENMRKSKVSLLESTKQII